MSSLDLGLDRAAVIVTGASSGIGLATARRLVDAGARVAMVARRADVLTQEAARLGDSAVAVPVNLAEPDAPERVVAATVDAFGAVDGLVNNAAMVRHLPLEQWPTELFDEHLATNVRAPFFLLQHALPHLRESSRSAVVNVSSSSGTLHLRGQSVYGMTKSALDYLTTSLAGELAASGVRVNAVAPGPVDTPIHRIWADDLEAAYVWLAEQVPLGRIGSTADLANVILFLLSPLASFITGAVVPVDGGQVIRP